MNRQATIQTPQAASIKPVVSSLLQRQCACGQHTVAGGKCEACRSTREGTLQRRAISSPRSREAPRLDAGTRAFMEPRFGHDFSRIPLHSPAVVPIQTKLAINHPGDQYEQEADKIADQVMATPSHTGISGAPPHIQRFSGQMNGQMDAAPASVNRALANPGRPLEPALRNDMEQRFGYDFAHKGVSPGYCGSSC